MNLFEGARTHGERSALIEAGRTASYTNLLDASERVARHLVGTQGDLEEARVAFLVPPGLDYAEVLWGIWRAGGVAVPLAISHPPRELAYVIADAGVSVVVTAPELHDRVAPVAVEYGLQLYTTEQLLGRADSPEPGLRGLPLLSADRRAMILYTSGTTSRPKGVVSTHANIQAQVETLANAWEWRSNDHILLVLPLHHLHGIVNVLTCALWSGARCTIHPGFDADAVWRTFLEDDLTLFMAVPTIYSRLIAAWEAASPAERTAMTEACRRFRLMVSGSAALPVSVLERWREISGHFLLERYGMTEIGMALSNPLHGERRPGHVGMPLPGVEVRLVDEEGDPVGPGEPGEIEVRGPSIFSEYWERPEATAESFRDGWFRTGDVAVLDDGYYRILGRSSVDILKTGGYKVSALEIEEVLRTHPAVAECAVVGLEDEEWGERVAAALVASPGMSITVAELREWTRERLASYKVPREVRVVPQLPRNAMGKVTKPEVKRLF